jgi:peptidoglycan/xylan/chitin deacetylase (PgdA/CDA1 family)
MGGRLVREALTYRARRVGAEVYYGSLRTLRITALRRARQDRGVVLCYHNVVANDGGQRGAPGLHLPLARFERQVCWLARHYAIVPLGQFVRQRRTRGARPLAAITFDDGYGGVFEHAVPLLRRLGIPATVFVVADATDRRAGFWWDHPDVIAMLTDDLRNTWLQELRGDAAAILSAAHASSVVDLPAACRAADWATIRTHAHAGVGIGVHSATHRALSTLTDVELEHEVIASRMIVHSKTGIWPEFFAYPYGLSDARVRAAVCDAGYTAAFSLGGQDDDSDRWARRRMHVPSGISDSGFEAWAAGLDHL